MRQVTTSVRHARLFEFLRQKNHSDLTEKRLIRSAEAASEAAIMEAVRETAAKSWDMPPIVEFEAEAPSPAEAGGYHELFGAVRA